MPKVTIWLTVYNHGSFLRRSIDSVLAQSFSDFELILADDCSQDDSWKTLQEYAAKDERIRVLRSEKNMGGNDLLFSQNYSDFRGRYVAILHDDDFWEPAKLEKQVAVLDSSANVAACFTWVTLVDENGIPLDDDNVNLYNHVFDQANRSRNEWLHYFFFSSNCLCHPSLLIRKEAYEQYGLIAHGLSSYPDFVKWIRLCRHTDLYVLTERLTNFRVYRKGENTSGDNITSMLRAHCEEAFIPREFANMSFEEMKAVFPSEIAQLKLDGHIPAFVLSQICLMHPSPQIQLYGLSAIYDMFQDRNARETLEKIYGYGEKAFNADKQRSDLFNVIPEDRYVSATLFVDDGALGRPAEAFTQTVYIPSTGQLCLNWRFKDSQRIGNARALFFTPDVEHYRHYRIDSVRSDGKPMEMLPIDATRRGEWDIFGTLAPQYVIQNPVAGSCIEVDYSVSEFGAAAVLADDEALRTANENLVDRLARIENSASWKITSPLRALRHRINRCAKGQ